MSRAQLTSTVEQNTGGAVAPFVAGKNKFINGDFYVNQRNLTSQTTDGAYGFDRWRMYASSGGTYFAQTFTPGTAPVAGYEGKNFARIVTTGQSGASVYTSIDQPIEDVRTFAGQTVTISFWAKAATGTPKISLEILQNFGSGGSATVITNATAVTISNAWVRYSVSVAIPPISGTTIGTGSYIDITFWVSAGTSFASRVNSIGIQSNTFDFWGIQVEAGSVATPFTTATGTLSGELAACQRYYQRYTVGALYGYFPMTGFATSTTVITEQTIAPVVMRVSPNSIEYGGAFQTLGGGNLIVGTITNACDTGNLLRVNCAVTGAVSGLFYQISSNNNINSYLAWSAEL